MRTLFVLTLGSGRPNWKDVAHVPHGANRGERRRLPKVTQASASALLVLSERSELVMVQPEPSGLHSLGNELLGSVRSGPSEIASSAVHSKESRSPHPVVGLLVLILLEMTFVLALIMITKCTRWEAVQTAAWITTVATGCFYARSALVTIGRRLVGTSNGHQGKHDNV